MTVGKVFAAAIVGLGVAGLLIAGALWLQPPTPTVAPPSQPTFDRIAYVTAGAAQVQTIAAELKTNTPVAR